MKGVEFTESPEVLIRGVIDGDEVVELSAYHSLWGHSGRSVGKRFPKEELELRETTLKPFEVKKWKKLQELRKTTLKPFEVKKWKKLQEETK